MRTQVLLFLIDCKLKNEVALTLLAPWGYR